jgi:hypothetical protein
MKLSKRDDLGRRWRSFKRHTFLLLQPLIIALLMTLLWDELWKRGLHFSEHDEVILTSAIIVTLGVTFSITAAVAFTSILDKQRQVVQSVIKKDKDTFLIYRDERLPIVVHLVLGSLSISIIGMVMLLGYHEEQTGLASVFLVTFSISLYFIVGTELQNTAKSAWFAERIPIEWLTIDVDDHFKLAEQHQEVPAETTDR